MDSFSNAFVRASAALGLPFDGSPPSVAFLDAYLLELRTAGISPSFREKLVLMAGAYVGGVIVNAGGGHWIVHSDTRLGSTAAVRLADGTTVCFPFAKVAKFLDEGPSQRLAPFVAVALHGMGAPFPPGVTVRLSSLVGGGEVAA